MLKAFKRTTLYFVYELVVLGVLYDAMIVFHLLTKNINGTMVILFLAILYLVQLGYFYYRK